MSSGKPLIDVKPDPSKEKDYHLFEYSALEKIDDAESCLERGHRLANGFEIQKDVNLGWQLILKAAREGHPVALALCFTAGVETARDDPRAVGLLKESGDRGHVIATFNLGVCYIQGVGVTRNFSEAARLFKKAAEKGFPAAQFNLGNCYGSGIGVSRNYLEACRWFRLASKTRTDAKTALTIAFGRLFDELTPDVFEASKAPEKWDEYVNCADVELLKDMALSLDAVSIAICIFQDVFITKTQSNIEKAILFLQKSIEPRAKFHLGLHYGIESKQGLELIKQAKEEGYGPAVKMLDPSPPTSSVPEVVARPAVELPRSNLPAMMQGKMIASIVETTRKLDSMTYFEDYIQVRDRHLKSLADHSFSDELSLLLELAEKVKDTKELDILAGKIRLSTADLPDQIDETAINNALQAFEVLKNLAGAIGSYEELRDNALHIVELTNSTTPDLFLIRDSIGILSAKVNALIARGSYVHIEKALPSARLKAVLYLEKAERWSIQARGAIELLRDRSILEMDVDEVIKKYFETLTSLEDLETQAFALNNRKRHPLPTYEEKEAIQTKINILELANLSHLDTLVKAAKYHSWILNDPTILDEESKRTPQVIDVTDKYRERMQKMFNESSVWYDESGHTRLGNDETHNRIVIGLKDELGAHKGYRVTKVEQINNPRLKRLYEAFRKNIIDLMKKDGKLQQIIPECFAEWQTEIGLIGKPVLVSANEVMLIHGCSADVTQRIIDEGFDHRTSIAQLRDNRIAYGYFGSGVYLAENASKADEYASADGFGNHKVFVCRALLGNPFVTKCDARANPLFEVIPNKQNRLWALQRAPYDKEHKRAMDSLVHICRRSCDELQSWPVKNSDFCVYDRQQVYPEFLVTYQRISTL